VTAAILAASVPDPAAGAEVTGSAETAGRFRIYLGVAPGAGKTVAMLGEGHRQQQQGGDVVVGFVECHGRLVTEARAAGLENVPRKVVEYRGGRFEEMDLDAVLRRHPQVALVDELAHTNLPGSGRHAKRWEDVLELLDAGIGIVATVNIQHLESVADTVERITRARVRERVPDRVVRRADQIELVDSSPEQLRRRMLHGNVYPADQVPGALAHFFRPDNLTVLRELALRFLADETGAELSSYLARYQPGVPWPAAGRILAAVSAAAGADVIIRRASQLAALTGAGLDIVHVTSDAAAAPGPAGDRLGSLRRAVPDAGACWHELEAGDPASALIDFARGHGITQIVIGSGPCSRWGDLLGGSAASRISRLAARAGLDVHIVARRQLVRS